MDTLQLDQCEWLAIGNTTLEEVKIFGNSRLSVLRQAQEQKLTECDVFPLVRLKGRKFACQSNSDPVLKEAGVSKVASHSRESVINVLRLEGLSINDNNAYKRDILESVTFAILCGKEGVNSPRIGHWLREYWEIGRGHLDAPDKHENPLYNSEKGIKG